MKTNKKVLVILLALAGAQSPVLAKKPKPKPSSMSCGNYESQNTTIELCVSVKNPNDTLNRLDYESIKGLSKNLFAKQKKALLNQTPKPNILKPIPQTVQLEQGPGGIGNENNLPIIPAPDLSPTISVDETPVTSTPDLSPTISVDETPVTSTPDLSPSNY
ncbi:MAG: hypothetical protein RLZZ361_1488 [Cyanobacteriota bacterium]|jgi:hypothetical protein